MEQKEYEKLKSINNPTWEILKKNDNGEWKFVIRHKKFYNTRILSVPTSTIRKMGNFYYSFREMIETLSDTYKNKNKKEYEDLLKLYEDVEEMWRNSKGNPYRKNVTKEVLEKASLVEVMKAYGLNIEVQNKRYVANCPFHNDSKPSLSIDEEKGLWHCWVCKTDDGAKDRGGTVIEFVRQYEVDINKNRLFTKKDAINKIIDICHLDSSLKQTSNEEQLKYVHNHRKYTDEQIQMIQALSELGNVSQYELLNSEDTRAFQYLKNRNMDEELMKKMEFGWTSKKLVEQWIQKGSWKNIPIERLEEIGFVTKGYDGKLRPTYNDRVLIPIHDERGNVVTFSGRSIDGEDPKYKLGRVTDVFKKDDLLYHYHVAKNSAYENCVYVVEGFMDVAAGEKIGVPNMVATMGCSISEIQSELLKKLKAQIILCRDNDKAGHEAMLREVPRLLNEGFQVAVVDLAKMEQMENYSTQEGAKKDLWDFACLGLTKDDLKTCTVHALDYMFANKYFDEKNYSSETIYNAYVRAQHDGILKNEKDKEMFVNFVQKHALEKNGEQTIAMYSSQQIRDILDKKALEKHSVMMPLYQNLLVLHLQEGIKKSMDLISKYSGISFHSSKKMELSELIQKTFFDEPEIYLSSDLKNIQFDSLIQSNIDLMKKTIAKSKEEEKALHMACMLYSYQSRNAKNFSQDKLYSYLKNTKYIHENLIRHYLQSDKIIQYSDENNLYHFAVLHKDRDGLLKGISSYDMNKEGPTMDDWGTHTEPIICGYNKNTEDKITLVFPNIIEMLSYQTLLNRQGGRISDYIYVSTEGTSLYNSLEKYCECLNKGRVVIKYKDLECSDMIEKDLKNLQTKFQKIQFYNELRRMPLGKNYSCMLRDIEDPIQNKNMNSTKIVNTPEER